MLVPILLSGRGLTGEQDPSRLVTGDLLTANNLDFSKHNLVEKEPGSSRINAVAISGSPSIMTGFDWWPTSSTQRRVIATSDGKLYKDDMTGTFATTLKSALGGGVTHMIEGGAEIAGNNRKLFICNGTNPVQVLSGDGVTTSNLATPPADWSGGNQPTFLFPFRGVMVGAGNANDQHRIYSSTATSHEDYTTGSPWNFSVYPGESHKLVSGITAFGKAWLWKYPTGIYFLNDSASASSGWFLQPATRQYGGAPTPHSLAQIDEAVVAFVSNTGSIILMQESSGTLTGVTFTDLTKTLNLRSLIEDNFNLGRLDRIQLRWYDNKKQLHVTFAAAGGAVENRRLVIDFNQERTRTAIVTKDTNNALWLELDTDRIPRLRTGDTSGFTWKLGQTARTVNGAAYAFTIVTAPTDFSDIDPKYMGLKLFRRLHLEYVPTGSFDVSVTINVDGKTKGTLPYSMGPAGSVLPFTLPATLGGDQLLRRSRAIVGEGFYFSLRITETGSNNPRLARAWAEFDLVGASR